MQRIQNGTSDIRHALAMTRRSLTLSKSDNHKNQGFLPTVHDRQSQATHFATTSRSSEFLGKHAKKHSE